MALDLRENIDALIKAPIGKEDAEILKKMLEELREKLIFDAVVKELVADPTLVDELVDAQAKLKAYKEELEAKVSSIEEETAPTEFEYSNDETLIPEINESLNKAKQNEHNANEAAKAARKNRLEIVRASIEKQIQELEILSSSLESVPEFIKNILGNATDKELEAITEKLLPSTTSGYFDIPHTVNGPLFEKTGLDSMRYKPNFERILEYFYAVADMEAVEEASKYLKNRDESSEIQEIDAEIAGDEERIATGEDILKIITPDGFDEVMGILKEIQNQSSGLPDKPSNFIQRIAHSFGKKKRTEQAQEKIKTLKASLRKYDLDAVATAITYMEFMRMYPPLVTRSHDYKQNIRETLDAVKNKDRVLRHMIHPNGNVENFVTFYSQKALELYFKKEDLESMIGNLKANVGELGKQRDLIQQAQEEVPLNEKARAVINTLGNDAKNPITLRKHSRYGLSPQAAFVGLATIAGIYTGNGEIQEELKKDIDGFWEIVSQRSETTREEVNGHVKNVGERADELYKDIIATLNEI